MTIPGPPASSGPVIVPPPPGPGVQAPFVAPPTDGSRRRRGRAVLFSVLAGVLVLVGGAGGVVGLVVLSNKATVDEARSVVTRYLTALERHQYGDAYDLLCSDMQASIPRSDFARRAAQEPDILGFTVGDVAVSTNQTAIEVPATLRTGSGTSTRTYVVVAEPSADVGVAFKVCGSGR